MAEIAIPLIALGSLYISSNKKCEKENFQIENNNSIMFKSSRLCKCCSTKSSS